MSDSITPSVVESSTATAERPTRKAKSTPVPATVPADSLVAKLASEQRELVEAAEAIFSRLARGGDQFDDDCLIFQRLGYDKETVRKETARVRSLLDCREAAGSDHEYAAAQAAALKLERETPEKLEQLAAQIAELEARRSAIERELSQAKRAVESMEFARRDIRRYLPSHVLAQFAQAEARLHRDLGAPVAAVDARLATVRDVLTLHAQPPSRERREAMILHLQAARPSAITRREDPKSPYITIGIDEADLNRYLDELRAELPELERLAGNEKLIYESELAAIEQRYLDQYFSRGS